MVDTARILSETNEYGQAPRRQPNAIDVKLSRIDSVLSEAEYPLSREAAADRFAGVTVLLADGRVDLGELVSETTVDAFDSAEDVATEIHNALPVGAVGEPGQSEGDG